MAVALDGVDRLLRQRCAESFDGRGPCDLFLPLDTSPGGFDQLDGGIHDFGADSIPADESYLAHGTAP